MCDPKELFGKRLKELRHNAKLSQEELAGRAELDRTYISSCERGKRNISILAIYRIAEALQVPPSNLLHRPSGSEEDV